MVKRSEKTPGSAGNAPTPSEQSTKKNTPPLREYKSRQEREAYIQRMVVLTTIAVTAVVVVILLLAFAYETLVVPNQTVATINDDNISVSEFVTRARLERGMINERVSELVATASQFGDQRDQYIQFATGQEPYATWINEMNVPDQLGLRVINSIIDERIIAAKAEELGITVTEEEIQAEIEKYFNFIPFGEDAPELLLGEGEETDEAEATEAFTPTPTPFVSPTPSPTVEPTEEVTEEPAEEATEEATPDVTPLPSSTPAPTMNATERFDEFTRGVDYAFDYVKRTARVSDADINAFFAARALRAKVAEALVKDTIDPNAIEVNARHILVETLEEAQDLIEAINAGESFADLAIANSLDGSGARGGELGWANADQYVPPFAEAVKTGEIGAILEPVQSVHGYHIIQVNGRREAPRDEIGLENAIAVAFTEHLKELRNSEEFSVQINDIWTENVPREPLFLAE